MNPDRQLSWALSPERYRHRSGAWYGSSTNDASASTLGNNTMRASPLLVGATTSFDLIGVEITAAGNAGATFRMGIYSDDGGGFPGSLLIEAGSVAADAIANPTLPLSLTLSPGVYWLAGVVQNAATTQPTIRAGSAGSWLIPWCGASAINAVQSAGWSVTTISGALPTAWGASLATAPPAPRIVLRVA